METIFFAVVAILVLGRLYQVLGQNHSLPPNIGEKIIAPKSQNTFIDENIVPDANEEVILKVPSQEEVLKSHWGPLYENIIAIKKYDNNFEPQNFLKGAGFAYESIINSYGLNDDAGLKPLVNEKVFAAFYAAMQQRKLENKSKIDIIKFAEPVLKSIEFDSATKIAQIDVEFDATLASAGENNRAIKEIWTFERKINSKDPIWRLIAVENL